MPGPLPSGSAVEFLKTDNGQRLAIILFSVLATVLMAAFPGSAGAVVLGMPYLFFIPGYALVRLFFWKGSSPESRLVLSLGLSVLVLIFLGLLLVFTIGLSDDTTRGSMVLFTLVAVALDFFWKRPMDKEKPSKATEETLPKTVKLDKVVAAMLGTALVVSAISLGLIITAEYPSRTYFAMTDENGSAEINKTRQINTTFSVILEVKNGEGKQCDFRIVVHNESWDIFSEVSMTLEDGQVWNEPVDIELVYYGVVRIDFDLFIKEEGQPEYLYGGLQIWLTVV